MDEKANDDHSWKQIITDSIIKAQNWNNQDEKRHQLLIQGSASIEDLGIINVYSEVDEGHRLVSHSDDSDDSDKDSTSLLTKIKSKQHSPSLIKKERSKKLVLDSIRL